MSFYKWEGLFKKKKKKSYKCLLPAWKEESYLTAYLLKCSIHLGGIFSTWENRSQQTGDMGIEQYLRTGSSFQGPATAFTTCLYSFVLPVPQLCFPCSEPARHVSIVQASSAHLLFTFPNQNLLSKKGWIPFWFHLQLKTSANISTGTCWVMDISLGLSIQLLLMADLTEIKLQSDFTMELIHSLCVSKQPSPQIWISLFTLPFLQLMYSPNQSPLKTLKGFPLAAANSRKAV